MIPSSKQIEQWAEDNGDGWVRIPASSWPELLWCLRQAEGLEARLVAFNERLDRRAANDADPRQGYPMPIPDSELRELVAVPYPASEPKS